MLIDAFGRCITYLRVSVTDRCNLRCLYCRGGMGSVVPISHDDVLRYEEIEGLIGLAVSLGVRKVRLTGGEPFVRKGFLPFVARVRAAWPRVSLAVTTNGTLIGGAVPELRRLGVSVNLSMDAMDAGTFAGITGRDEYGAVAANLGVLLSAGVPVKINAVALRGRNDASLPDFLRLAMDEPIDVRFIEFMPMGGRGVWDPRLFLPEREILGRARSSYRLEPVHRSGDDAGPARLWRLVDSSGRRSVGRFGVIASVTHDACASCNRLRLTAEGRLRTCLFSDQEYRLRGALRHPRLGLEAVRRILFRAVGAKPLGSALLARRRGAVSGRRMDGIGG